MEQEITVEEMIELIKGYKKDVFETEKEIKFLNDKIEYMEKEYREEIELLREEHWDIIDEIMRDEKG